MKKLLLLLALLPLAAGASVIVPWNQPTGQVYITPGLVSGVSQPLVVSSLATSTFLGGIISPCFSVDGVTCITGGGSGGDHWATSTGDPTAIIPAGGQKVGIGTSTPGFPLSVDGQVTFQGLNFATTTIGSNSNWLQIGELDAGIFRLPILLPHNSNPTFDGFGLAVKANNFAIFPGNPASELTSIGLNSSDLISSFSLTFDPTLNKAYTLGGNSSNNTSFIINDLNTVNGYDTAFGAYATTSTSDAWATKIWDNASNLLLGVRADGNVGIGTTNPTSKLTVNGGGLFGDITGGNTLEVTTTTLFGQTVPIIDPTINGLGKIGLLNGIWFVKEDPTGSGGAGQQPEFGFFNNDGSVSSFITMSTTSGSMAIQNQAISDVSNLVIASNATTTSNVGFDITNGCYAINGVCTSSSGGTADQNWSIANVENEPVLTPTTTDYAIYGVTSDTSGSDLGQGFGSLFSRDFATTTENGPVVYTTKAYTGLATTTDLGFTQIPIHAAIYGVSSSSPLEVSAGYSVGVVGNGLFGGMFIGHQQGLFALGASTGASIACSEPSCLGLDVQGQSTLQGSTVITGTVNNVGLTVNGETSDDTTYSAKFNNSTSGLILGARNDGSVVVNNLASGGTKCVHADTNGILGLATDDCGTGGSSSSDFTFLPNFGVIMAATSSPLLALNGLYSSTTIVAQGDAFATTTIGDHNTYFTFDKFDGSFPIPEIKPSLAAGVDGRFGLLDGNWYVKEDTDGNAGTGSNPAIGWISNDLNTSAVLTMATTSGDVNFTGAGTFTFNNPGNLIVSSLAGTGDRCLHTDSIGVITATGADCGSGGSSSDFTFTNNFGGVVAATSSALWFKGPVYASSTLTVDGLAKFPSIYPQGPGTVPTLDNELIDLKFARGLLASFLYKFPVALVSTSTISLSGEQTIDGTLTSATRVLVVGQGGDYTVANSGNGCYVTAAGSWTRCTDYDTTGEVLQGTTFGVSMGMFNAGSQWSLLTANPVVVGTTPLTFIPTNIVGVTPIIRGGTNNSSFSRGNIWFDGTSITSTSSVFTVGSLIATTTTNSIFGGALTINGTATSTAANGFNITTGCYAVAGVCITGGSGITAIGPTGQTQTGSTQTLATSTAGTDFRITAAGNTQTFNLPVASAINTGKLSNTDWSTFNGKQAAGNYITALTGDVTAAGPGSAAATIANSAVTLAKMANLAANSVIGNPTGSSAVPQALATSSLKINISDTIGVLSIARGGTNNSSAYTAGSAIFSDGTSLTQDNANYFWDNTNKRLGIGNAAPSQKLHITTTNDTSIIRLQSTANTANNGFGAIQFDSNSSAGTNRTYGSITGRRLISTNALETGELVFSTLNGGGSNAVVTMTGNKVGVGTSTPDNRLDVQDTFGVTNSTNGQGFLRFTNASGINYIQSGLNEVSGSVAPLVWAPMKSITNNMRLDSTGLGIGVVPTEKLDVNGNVNLPTTSSTVGQWKQNGTRFVHTFGTDNFFAGTASGNFTLTTGSAVSNTGIGARTLDALTTGDRNMALGADALGSLTSGLQNSAIGSLALSGCTSCQFNVGIGAGTLIGVSTQNRNIAIGNTAGQGVSGSRNILIGVDTGKFISAFDDNVIIGTESGEGVNGSGNVLLGRFASTTNAISYGTAIGYGATVGLSNAVVLGTSTTKVGIRTNVPTEALDVNGSINLPNTTATDGIIKKNGTRFIHGFGSFNFFGGQSSGNLTLSGNGNAGIGFSSLAALTSGSTNTGIGSQALLANTSGSGNTGIGSTAGSGITTGVGNTAVGDQALTVNNTTNFNTAVGQRSLAASTGSNNTAVGNSAGVNLTSGDKNIILGYNINFPSSTGSNQLNIGNIIFGTGVSGTVTTIAGSIGIASSTPFKTFSVNGTVAFQPSLITTNIGGSTYSLCLNASGEMTKNSDNETCIASSRRFKKDIEPLTPGLNEILAMQPVSFEYKEQAGEHYGLIAEDVAAIDPLLSSYDEENLPNGIKWSHVTALLVNAVKEQQTLINNLKVGVAKTTRSAEENWQWGMIVLLGLGLALQQRQINKLKK